MCDVFLTDRDEYSRRQIDVNPYGDGKAAERIADLIARRAWEDELTDAHRADTVRSR